MGKWHWRGRDKPQIPGTSTKVENRRRRKARARKTKREKLSTELTEAEIEALYLARPLLGEIDEMLSNRHLVHSWGNLSALRDHLLKGGTLTRQYARLYHRTRAYLYQLEDMPRRLTAHQTFVMETAIQLRMQEPTRRWSPVRTRRLVDPVQVILGEYRENGWVAPRAVAMVQKRIQDDLHLLEQKVFQEHDLVIIEGKPRDLWTRSAALTEPASDKRVGLVVGSPLIEHGEVVIHVMDPKNDGQVMSFLPRQLTLKASYTDDDPDV